MPFPLGGLGAGGKSSLRERLLLLPSSSGVDLAVRVFFGIVG